MSHDRAVWQALAHEALLDHVNRGDARHALKLLVDALARRCADVCTLSARADDGSTRWQMQGRPGIGAAASVAASKRQGFTVNLPLSRLGRDLGTLQLQAQPGVTAGDLEADMAPLLQAAAALLLNDAAPDHAAAHAGRLEATLSALQGAGTFVWEWDIQSDWLGDIDQGLQMLGYAPHKHCATQQDWDALIHPDDRVANHEAFLRHARGETEAYEHAYRIRASDGQWRWMHERGRIVEWQADGQARRMVGTQTDITEQRRNEQADSQAAARLERIALHVPGVLYQFELDADMVPRFPYMSEQARVLLGLDPAAAVNASALMDRIEAADREAVVASIVESAHTLQQWRCEFRVRGAEGALRWIVGTASPMRGADGTTVWHGYMQDVTELRELGRARQDKAAAEAANRAKTEFLSRMSHELRTPLNAVLGFSQLLEMERVEPLSDGQRRRVSLIREAGEHLLQMITDLLDLTRIESGSLQVQIEAVPLRALAQEAADMLRPLAEAARIELSLQIDDADLAARADRTRLRQVLLNLLSNAIKYNRNGGSVELQVAPCAGTDGRPCLSIQVSDSGVGIDAADLPHLFEPFNRLAQAHGGVEGTGIGLSVTRALVMLMHGRIEVRSTPGVGTSFVVTLPRA
jgi:PAS domain S-box-containing protein